MSNSETLILISRSRRRGHVNLFSCTPNTTSMELLGTAMPFLASFNESAPGAGNYSLGGVPSPSDDDFDSNVSAPLSGNAAGVQAAYVVVMRIQTVLLPFICLVGIVGNVLAVGAFLSPPLRTTSCCLFLASKSVADIGFLLSLFIIWLYRIRVPIITTNGVCQVTVFLSYVCAFLSVWFVVIITAENFIRISHPLRVATWCCREKALIVIGIVVFIALALYNFPLWTTGVVEMEDSGVCTQLQSYQHVLLVMTYVDSVITLLVPSVLMVFLVLAILTSACKIFKRRQRLQTSATLACQENGSAENGCANTASNAALRRKLRKRELESSMTRFLFVISLIFLFLHTPSHIIRLKMMIQNLIQGLQPPVEDFILQRAFELLYYFNFSTNCFVCLLFGENFRKVFTAMYFRRCSQSKNSRPRQRYSPLALTGLSMTEDSLLRESPEREAILFQNGEVSIRDVRKNSAYV